MPRFEDSDLGADLPESLSPRDSRPSVTIDAGLPLPIPADPVRRNRRESEVVEVPASRSSISDAAQFMHNLSLQPSMLDRRASRNSFGTSLPIPRSSRPSRLSSVVNADGSGAVSRDILASQVQDMAQEKVLAAKNMAFAFDIDGVLAHGNKAIPQAKEALKMLNGDNELGIKIPYILLTNGSGKTEEERCQQLTDVLDSPISVDQFIQSHTPMRALSEYYETVLLVGGEGFKCRDVAVEYGFKNVYTYHDILAWNEEISPWRAHRSEKEIAQASPIDFSKVKFDAILVFSDSRDYSTDFQLIIDLLMSEDGYFGTKSKNPGAGSIPIYFSQGDMLMPTAYKGPPRMTQGAFRISIETMYKALTGTDLERVVYGKPELATYKYADEVLKSWMEEIHNENKIPANVYMVGDNPASDIIGGNMYGWNTCLVRTGIFQGGPGENDPKSPANFGVFDHVLDAVKAVVRKELGKEFKFKWNEKLNPVLHGDGISAIE
ncbi:uncharacterized protein TRUGW13939_02876 [Talaromyces rugulosus]|uniref:Uncharacterized protein n=1 Tax=Talaromyces rugulosus TaxID=121627 RepID=A0A7H8QPH4_TALRU|nr:uncharacterized protein TRUGW13939_02876 [Talaromyces rugulosus]QKX55778.1 hypothetical protein TRUGW13939_02876 [Talaromyces rugulosus]